jgi:hypothetical protein
MEIVSSELKKSFVSSVYSYNVFVTPKAGENLKKIVQWFCFETDAFLVSAVRTPVESNEQLQASTSEASVDIASATASTSQEAQQNHQQQLQIKRRTPDLINAVDGSGCTPLW